MSATPSVNARARFGSQSRSRNGFRSLDHHGSFVAASTKPSFAMKRRKPSSPKTS